MNYFEEKNSYSLNFKYNFMPDSLPIIKKMTLYACHFKTNSYLCINFSCTRQFESKLSLLLSAKVLQKRKEDYGNRN